MPDPARYDEQLAEKCQGFQAAFAAFDLPQTAVFASAPSHYRLRAEFRIWHHGDTLDYAMFDPENPKRPILLSDYPVTVARISDSMPILKLHLLADERLKKRLYAIEFLATLSGELLVTLIYHRKLDEEWESAARKLAADLNLIVIGRSRGQKIVLDRDWVEERFELNGRHLAYRQYEGAFSQPNGGVNRQMLAWAQTQVAGVGGDLLELYCGNGNFTMALAPAFDRVLATEMSKTSVQAALHNQATNGIDNLKLVRMSSEEISAALAGTEQFNRLRDIDLASYRFSTLFVDPPRSGLDPVTLSLAAKFDNILYISCNPASLHDNVARLHTTHQIAAAAVFDQFPYTHHLECGLLLQKRQG